MPESTATNATMTVEYECATCDRSWKKTIVAVDGLYEVPVLNCAGCRMQLYGIILDG